MVNHRVFEATVSGLIVVLRLDLSNLLTLSVLVPLSVDL